MSILIMKLPVRRPKAEVPPVIYILGDCALDIQRHTLHCAGRPIRLRLKAFQILTYLLAHRDRLISKQELAEQVWPDHFVSDAALEGTIKTVRQAIGDSGRAQQLIRTVHGAGYRFIAAVAESPDIPAGLQDESPRDQPDARSVLPRDAPNVAPSPPAQDAVGGDEGFGRLSGGEQDTAPRRSDSPTPGEWRLVTVLCCAPVTSSSVGAQQDAETQYH